MTKTCEACQVFTADVVTPVGDGARDLCWLCAHYVTVHAMPIGHIPESLNCGCPKTNVYPQHVLVQRDLQERQSRSGAHASARAAKRHDDQMAIARTTIAKRASMRLTR